MSDRMYYAVLCDQGQLTCPASPQSPVYAGLAVQGFVAEQPQVKKQEAGFPWIVVLLIVMIVLLLATRRR